MATLETLFSPIKSDKMEVQPQRSTVHGSVSIKAQRLSSERLR